MDTTNKIVTALLERMKSRNKGFLLSRPGFKFNWLDHLLYGQRWSGSMEFVVLCGVLFRFAATYIAVALHGCDGKRANGQHRSCRNIHCCRQCACYCLVIKEVIGKMPVYTAT